MTVMTFLERLDDHQTSLRAALDGRQANIWTALPGIIDAVNYTALTCTVQPAIQASVVVGGKRENTTITQLVDVPLVWQRGGVYTMTFPVKAGDECLVVFSSRCIDNWWAHGNVQPQYELRMHDLSDGFALVGPFSQSTKITNVNDTTVQLRTNDGTMFCEIDAPNKKVRTVTPNTEIVQDDTAKKITMTAGTTTIVQDGTANTITLTAGTTSLVINGDTGIISGIGQNGVNVTAPVINLN